MKLPKFLIFFISRLCFFGCQTKYATKECATSEIPKTPDYSDLNSWAAHSKKVRFNY